MSNRSKKTCSVQKSTKLLTLKIVFVYVISSILWIAFSDTLLQVFFTSKEFSFYVSLIKGMVFVFATGFLLFILINRAILRERFFEDRLIEATSKNAKTVEIFENNEQKYKTFFDKLYNGLIELKVLNQGNHPKDYIITMANEVALQFLSLRSEEITNKSLQDILPFNDEAVIKNLKSVFLKGISVVDTFEFSKPNERLYHLEYRVFKLNEGEIAVIIDDETSTVSLLQSLQRSLNSERIISFASDIALKYDKQEKIIGDILTLVGQSLNVSRTYLFTYNESLGALSLYFAWVNKGIKAFEADYKDKPVPELKHMMEKLKNNENVFFSNIEDIEDEALKDFAKKRHRKSLLSSPVFVNGAFYGFIGYDECERIRENVSEDMYLFQSISGIISQLISRSMIEKENEYLSLHDSLTGLYNRIYLEKQEKELSNKENQPLSVIIGDVNGLKITNDIFGHIKGDKLLIEIANILKGVCREKDIAVRWGGDEFVLLLPNTNSKEAEEISNKIYEMCSKVALSHHDDATIFSISLGYATKENEDDNLSHLIKKAEDFMYNRKLFESRSTHNAVIAYMKETLYEKSNETQEHCLRIGTYCIVIGRELGLKESVINKLELFSMLHDIGKIAIDDKILKKNCKLSKDEYTQIQRHSEIGYRIAQSTPELSQISDYILAHHERWDGNGYPQNLKGEKIPLLARILAVADAFDAMTNDRSYRKAVDKETAIAELRKNSGTQFDPHIVEVFVKILERKNN